MYNILSRSSRWTAFVAFVSFLCCLFTPTVTVKHVDFKICDQSGFCKRNRAYADSVSTLGSTWNSPYRLDSKSITFSKGQLRGTILKRINGGAETVRLPITVSFQESGTARVTVDEERRQKGEVTLLNGSKARKERYNEAEAWAIVGGLKLSKTATLSSEQEDGVTKVLYGPDNSYEAVIQHSPFGANFKRDGEIHVRLNERSLLNVEHWRPKIEKETKEIQEGEEAVTESSEDESTWWAESFGGNTDTKPKGPESVALDISFPGYEHVFGIPEHSGPLSLKETSGGKGGYSEPYRLYNSDVFEYEIDSPMTLYGAIPFMQAHRKGSTVGVFWLNAAETWIDIRKAKVSSNPLSLGIGARTDTQTHWISEGGLLDVFIFLGPTPKKIVQDYTALTGYTQLPQHFSIAYHQCRWNYVTDEDVKDVDQKFDRHDIPYDVIWLDIEYTDGKKYFTWDSHNFPDPIGMQKQLDQRARKLVIIIDPHIKNEGGYHIVEELKSMGFAAKNKDGNHYEGWCWPGSSYWVDCFNPAAREWWKKLFKYENFKGTGPNTFLWNDMNEPSVFNGPDMTSPRDNIHHGGWEHRDLHNINGMTFINATYDALLERKKGEIRRPFVLTRSYFAGSQRMGAVWTGDNQANWEHLAVSIPMCLANGIAGFPFCGADVGGFFGNPSKELLTRWYQAGAFYPFFRAHAHIDTRRREPYLAGDPYSKIITQALRLRYQLLPAWYTAFHEASVDGSPIIRPSYYVHPSDEKGFAIDDQLYLGSTGILAKPVVTEGAESVDIYISDDEPYYDYFDYTIHTGKGTKTLAAPLNTIPLLMQGGHIIPRRDRPRRSSGLMRWDPFTLVVVLNSTGHAEGTLYLDDGETFDYKSGAFVHRKFSFDRTSSKLVSTDLATKGSKTAAYVKTMAKVRVEKVIVVGAPTEWAAKKEVKVSEDGGKSDVAILTYHAAHDGKAAWAVIRDPKVAIVNGWTIDFS